MHRHAYSHFVFLCVCLFRLSCLNLLFLSVTAQKIICKSCTDLFLSWNLWPDRLHGTTQEVPVVIFAFWSVTFCSLVEGHPLVEGHFCRYTQWLQRSQHFVKYVSCKLRVCMSVYHHTFNWINKPDAANSQVYYLSFKYSSTCLGHSHTHHQELQQLP